jgi:hypothetical protein
MSVFRITTLIVSALLMGCSSHEELPPPDNPFDPGNPDYISPAAVIVSGPGEGEVVSTTEVEIAWEGNESATEYRYKFDSPNWSDWDEVTSHIFDYLDEGNHSFEVQARSVNGDEQSGSSLLDFEVDAVAGPSILVYPFSQIGSPGDTLECQIIAEEVTNVYATACVISFDTDYLELLESSQGDILTEWGGNSLIVEELADSSLSISMVASEGSSISFSGTSSLLELKFKISPIAIDAFGLEVIRISEITYLDPNLVEIDVNSNRLGILNVQ